MACIEKIYSVSALVGGPGCNGKCAFCAGAYLRPQAHKDSPNFLKNLEAAIKLSARYGGWSLSLTSSGEPTLYPESVTMALGVYRKCAEKGAYFPNVNLFTNGINFGDKQFCKKWLPLWKTLGLTYVAISIHAPTRLGQELVYKTAYPAFSELIDNIRIEGVGVRATLLLRKGEVDNAQKYAWALDELTRRGFDNITSWPVANPDGSRNEFTPSRRNLLGIRYWLWKNAKLCHGHAWGGGVYDWKGNMVRLTDYVTRHDPSKNFVRQLVVFQNGDVAYSWIKEGALCMK